MKERPILFRGDMVRAIFAGHKTQTRRPLKMPYKPLAVALIGLNLKSNRTTWAICHPNYPAATIVCPYGEVGDRLWVRETWAQRMDAAGYGYNPSTDQCDVRYKASTPDLKEISGCFHTYLRWVPSIHMPRWACRLTLEITKVRLEPLQAISQDDAVAEGIDDTRDFKPGPGRIFYAGGPREAYSCLWDKINGKKDKTARWELNLPNDKCWRANPWVWVVEFKVV